MNIHPTSPRTAFLSVGVAVTALVLLFSGLPAFGNTTSAHAQSPNPPASGTVVSLVPNRIADSRIGLSFATFSASEQQDLQVTGRGGVPLTGVGAVILNVTAVNSQAQGFLTVWPDDFGRPNTSNVNFASHDTIANTVIVKVQADGAIGLFNGSAGTLDVLVDVEGYIPS
jgi:hypothetical protein